MDDDPARTQSEKANSTDPKALRNQQEVRKALQRSHSRTGHPPPRPPVAPEHKVGIGLFAFAFVGLAALHYMVRLEVIEVAAQYDRVVGRMLVAAEAAVLILLLARLIDLFAIAPIEDDGSRFNFRQVLRLGTVLGLALVLVSVLFANWYTAAVSFGVVSLILGLALQSPITSFIGWMYILSQSPYKVGDRIQMGDVTGDVIRVGYLDTTLWEFGGEYLSTDHPSGRIVKFPNARVLDTPVHNYSWPLFPYIWDEIALQIGYDSDLSFMRETMRRVADEELGPEMHERIDAYRELLAETPVDELVVREHPTVFFRISSNTWVEAVVRYLVEPRRAGPVRTRLLERLLTELNREPERVRFPRGDSR